MNIAVQFRCIVLLSLSLFGTFRAPAADSAPGAEAKRAAKAHDDALTLVRTGNVSAAEASISTDTLARPGTTRWRLEVARRLTALASASAGIGRPSEVRTLANRALIHLQEVARDGAEPRLQASALALAGNIYERYLGDPANARASYRAAAERNPADRRATENLARLEAADKRRKG